MPENDPVLSRTYTPRDLESSISKLDIDKTVLVQAAETVNETEYMLGIADASDLVSGVVGWIDFEKREDRATLARFAAHPKFEGVRPMIQDTSDDDWMLRDDVQWGFDALGFPRHLKNLLTILTRYPDMRAVLDHCIKPQIRGLSAEANRIAAATRCNTFSCVPVTECPSSISIRSNPDRKNPRDAGLHAFNGLRQPIRRSLKSKAAS